VLSLARELGATPGGATRVKQIAIVTQPPQHNVMGGYVHSVTQYVCFALSRANANITLITEDRLPDLADMWFDGIIGVAWQDETIAMLRTLKNVPVVWLSDLYADSFHSVYTDGGETGMRAGEYLIKKGHRRLAVLHDPDYLGAKRVAGVAAALRKAKLPPENLLALSHQQPLHLAVKQVLDAECTAVWVTGVDLKVLEVNWLLQELAGKKIPEGISLLGFENPGISEFLRPSLTTLATPLREMAEKAVEIVLRDKPEKLVKVKFSTQLIERNSVAAI
jgi:DNA-binding LacI/PurR family transcriptional regulator